MERCNISDQGAEYLMLSLKMKSCKLKLLDVSKNNIREKGAKFLAQGLVENKALKVLFLHWN